MPKLNDDQRRALNALAHQDGCAEAMLLADGFSIDQLAGGWWACRHTTEARSNQRSDEDRGLDADHHGPPDTQIEGPACWQIAPPSALPRPV